MPYNKKGRFQNRHKIRHAGGLEPKALNYREELTALVGHRMRIEGTLVAIHKRQIEGYAFVDCVIKDARIVKVPACVRDSVEWQTLDVDHMHVFVSRDAPQFDIPCQVLVKGVCCEYVCRDGKRNIGIDAFTIRENSAT